MTTITSRCQPMDGGWRCDVDVDDGRSSGRHVVTVSEADADTLAAAHADIAVERLVHESFQFLLEREPRSSILRSFDLAIISQYFPEYRAEMAARLAP
jgi:hypothetical protein